MSQELIVFPCIFPIKVLGINDELLLPEVIAIINSHTQNFDSNTDISIKPSKLGNYISITLNILATSKQQLDTIYLELNKHKLVKATL